MRSFLLGTKVIAERDVALSDESIGIRKADYLRELRVRFPSLRHTNDAHVEILTQSNDHGLLIEAHLRESTQLSLSLSTDRVRGDRNLQNDLFLQLVQRLDFERGQLLSDAALASDTSQLVQQISTGVACDERTLELRHLASRIHSRSKSAVGGDGNVDQLGMDIPPRLEVTEHATIRARVLSLTARSAQLGSVSEEPHSSVSRTSGQALPKKLALRRINGKDYFQFGHLLREAMDHGKNMVLEVNVRFNGVDGQVADLELKNVQTTGSDEN